MPAHHQQRSLDDLAQRVGTSGGDEEQDERGRGCGEASHPDQDAGRAPGRAVKRGSVRSRKNPRGQAPRERGAVRWPLMRRSAVRAKLASRPGPRRVKRAVNASGTRTRLPFRADEVGIGAGVGAPDLTLAG